MAGSSSSSAGDRMRTERVMRWQVRPTGSPTPQAPAFRRSDERPVVSGLGLSSSASSAPASPGVDSGVAMVARADAEGPLVPDPREWILPRPSRRSMWRRRKERQTEAEAGPSHRRVIAPEMDGLCFKCF
jgi:hypothetical protein